MNHVKAWSLINRGQKSKYWGNGWPCTRQRPTFFSWEQHWTLFKGSTFSEGVEWFSKCVVSCRILTWLWMNWYYSQPSLIPWSGRERLARLKSSLNLKLVQHYKDKKGASKIKGGPHLTQSSEYPVNLGIKACMGYFFFPNNNIAFSNINDLPMVPFYVA